jgi:hypothetical protein
MVRKGEYKRGKNGDENRNASHDTHFSTIFDASSVELLRNEADKSEVCGVADKLESL